jgi:hypothetical protein
MTATCWNIVKVLADSVCASIMDLPLDPVDIHGDHGESVCTLKFTSLNTRSTVLTSRRGVGDGEFVHVSLDVGQHGQLIQQYLVEVLADAQQLCCAEAVELVALAELLPRHEVVQRDPELALQLRHLQQVDGRHLAPLVVDHLLPLLCFGISPACRHSK